MNKIFVEENEIKEMIVGVLREKVAVRYSYKMMDELVDDVLNEPESREKLQSFVRSTLAFLNNDKAFEKHIKDEFQRKVAKSMVGKLEGTVEKAVDVLRQDPTLRAEMLLAIERIIKSSSQNSPVNSIKE